MTKSQLWLIVSVAACVYISFTTVSLLANDGSLITVSLGNSPVRFVEFSPDGRYVAAGADDGDVHVFEVEQGQALAHFQFEGRVTGLAWYPDGKSLAASAIVPANKPRDGRIRGWRIADQQPLFSKDLPGIIVSGLAMTDTGRSVIACGQMRRHDEYFPRGWMEAWNAADGKSLDLQFPTLPARLKNPTISPGNGLIYYTTDHDAYDFTFKSRRTRKFSRRISDVYGIDVSADGKLLAVAGYVTPIGERYGHATIWDVTSNRLIQQLRIPGVTAPLTDIAFSPSADRVAISTLENQLPMAIVDIANKRVVSTFATEHAPIHSIAINPAGDRLVSAADDGNVQIWDVRRGGGDFWIVDNAKWGGKQLWRVGHGRRHADLYDTRQESGRLVSLETLGDLRSARLQIDRISADDLHHLKSLKEVRSLVVASASKKPLPIDFLNEFSRLESLDLRGVDSQATDLTPLHKMFELKDLKLGAMQVADPTFSVVISLPNVRSLTLSVPHATSGLAETLQKFRRLETLEFPKSEFSKSDVEKLVTLKNVTQLKLGTINDDALAVAITLTQLTKLEFDASRCTRKEIVQLAGMPNLKSYSLRNNPFPPTALPYLASIGPMDRNERLRFYEDTSRSVTSKFNAALRRIGPMQPSETSLAGIQLRNVDVRIAYLDQMSLQYAPRRQSSSGFFGGLYDSVEDSGNSVARGKIAKDMAELKAQRRAILDGVRHAEAIKVANLTPAELQFGNAFGLLGGKAAQEK